jgi:hypothetical protein
MLHQILNAEKGSGKAVPVIQQFFDEVATNVWLTVRADNDRACAFYRKVGFDEVGETSWMKGKLLGRVFFHKKEVLHS